MRPVLFILLFLFSCTKNPFGDSTILDLEGLTNEFTGLTITPALTGSDATPTGTGSTKAGSIVQMFSHPLCMGTLLASATAASDGSFSATPTETIGPNGLYNFSFLVTDLAGDTSCSSTTVPYTLNGAFALCQTSTSAAAPISGLSGPGQVVVVGNKLIVADSNNNRVLIWNDYANMTSLAIPDVVIGQQDKGQLGSRTASNRDLTYPFGVASDGTKLFVSDLNNNRVLVWNTIPTSDYALADFVLGQPEFTSAVSATTQTGLSCPYEIYAAAGKLIVGDYCNGRAMVWNLPITANGQPADLVLGQADFTTKSSTASASVILGSDGVWTDGTKVLVADYSGNRVLGWNTYPTANGQAADFVLGQPDFTSTAGNNGGLTAARLSRPWDVKSDGTRVFVADAANHRVLIWNSWPTTGQAADFTLGQANGTSNSANQGLATPTGQTMFYPEELFVTSNELLVSDNSNNRIVAFDLAALATNATATRVIGQNNFTEAVPSLPTGGVSSSNVNYPLNSASDGTHLAVADCNNNRVLIWNSIVTNNAPADIVIGQSAMTAYAPNDGGTATAATLNCPAAVAFSGTKLLIADKNNSRILVYNQVPTTNGAAADVVLGQPDLISSTANNGGISGSRLNKPAGLLVSGTKLVVSDQSNHRVLIWNSVPTASGTAADLVLGQANMTSGGAAAAASGLYYPAGNPATDGTKLVVGDSSNNRVLIWNTWPTVNGQAADVVVGQPNMTYNRGSWDSFVIDTKITDSSAHRVTLYALDWDNTARVMQIDVQDENGNILDSQTVSAYQGGTHYTWNVKGRVQFRVQHLVGGAGAISGIFFDPVSGGGVPTGSRGAVYVGQDTATKGSWIGTYGSDGYMLANSDTLLPSYVSSIDFEGRSDYVWAATTADIRGVQNAAGTSRTAACWYTNWNPVSVNSKTFYYPTGVFLQGGRLLVADFYNNRVLIWNSVPVSNGTSADQVYGQPNFLTKTVGFEENALSNPNGFLYTAPYFYITDSFNSRILAFPTTQFPQFAP